MPPLGNRFALPFVPALPQKNSMDSDPAPTSPVQRFVQWAIKPPQSYAVYLVCLILVFTLSFYAGSLKPKHVPASPPAAAPSAPRG
jgi:hypothetical protein